MVKKHHLPKSQSEHATNIQMENLEADDTRGRYAQNSSVGRDSSLPSSGLRRRRSEMEEWEADLVDQLPSRQGAGAAGTMRLNKTLRGRRKSTKAGFGTVRHPKGLDDLNTDEIVENLLNDPDFADGPSELQAEDIKGLHTNLARKLSIQAKLRKNEERANVTKHITWSKQVRYSIALVWKRTRVNMAEVSYSVDLWRGHLKKIEGKFGSGVAAYFSFMKWLVQLNVPVFILLFGFITIPQLLHKGASPSYGESKPFTGYEILTGEGWFEHTELYYGSHHNGSIERIGDLTYSMPHAYLITVIMYYVITVIALLYSITKSYKVNFIDATSIGQFQSVTKVLCGWDFAITAPQASVLKRQSIHKELQEYLSVFRTSDVKRTGCQTCGIVLLRIFINLLCIGLIAGAGYLIRYVSHTLRVERDGFYGLEQLALPVVISTIIFILPLIFSFLCDYESYDNPQVTVYLVMARTIVLFIVSLGVIVQYWFTNMHCSPETRNSTQTCSECWENFLGYNMYRLVVVDFLVTLLITFITEFVRRLIAQYCIKALGYPEFDIGRNTLYLIYSQALIWIAVFYSPLLPLIVIAKLILLFYVKRYSIMNNCKPSVKPYRGGRAHTITLTLLGLALMLCFIAVGYSIFSLKPSVACGPYRQQETTYSVIKDLFEAWAEHEATFSTIVEFITSAGFLAAVILGLLIAAYYTRIRARGLDESVLALKEQIALEGKDKKFLIKLIQSAGPSTAANRGPRTRNANYANVAISPGNKDCDDDEAADCDDDEAAGGKQFTKATMEAAYGPSNGDYNTVPGAPRNSSGNNNVSPTRDSGETNRSPHSPRDGYSPRGSGEPYDAYNEGFVDRSLDPYDQGHSCGPSVNPAYNDESLTNRPNLPYPRHYDIIKNDKDNNRRKK